MPDVRISLRVEYSNGAAAAGIDVKVLEPGRATKDVGKTGMDGSIDAFVRRRRRWRIFGLDFEDPFDQPRLTLELSDPIGQAIVVPDEPLVRLPSAFDLLPPEAPTNPVPLATSPSDLANVAVRTIARPLAPGYVFLIKKNGVEWANATWGLSRLNGLGVSAKAMTNDTILQLASMSKPITATAVVAMIDDWRAIQDAVIALGRGPAAPPPVVSLTVSAPFRLPRTVAVPTVLAPLFTQKARAREFLDAGLLLRITASVRDALSMFASASGATVSPVPVSPPGHIGLLRRVLRGDPVPQFSHAFLPLIRERLGAGAVIGADVQRISLADLLTHHTDFDRTGLSPELRPPPAHTAAEIDSVRDNQPADGGLASVDYWGHVRLLLNENGAPTPDRRYSNNNYTVLTTVIEACTETVFDEYVIPRLFFDPRFGLIRRRVVDVTRGALYYNGTAALGFTGGVLFPDFSNWPGNGGFYVTGQQITDWMHALYTRAPVGGVSGPAPLISADGFNNLFGMVAFFSLGITDRNAPATPRFQHNGGAGVNGGFVNGNLAIYESPGGDVYTAFYDANGSLPADDAFDAAFASLVFS